MVFRMIDFLNAPQQQQMPDLVSALARGYQAGLMPRQEARAQRADDRSERAAALAEAMKAAQLKAYPGQVDLSNQLKRAQLEALQAKTQLPFGGEIAPGEVGQAMWLERLKQQAGSDSEVYQRAAQAYDTAQKARQGLVDYRSALTGTADKRYATPLGKRAQEQLDIELGFLPGTNRSVQLAPEQQEKLREEYKLKGLKETTDTQFRNKAAFARNIDKTFDQTNVDDLVQYAGVPGTVDWFSEVIRAPFGMQSPEFNKFQKALTGANLLAKQIRQFYGDSIQPQVLENLKTMTNPASWQNNPELAKQAFNQLKDILAKETQTYTKSLQSSKELLEGEATPKERQNLPKFQSKEEFQKYLMRLTPAERSALKTRMFKEQ